MGHRVYSKPQNHVARGASPPCAAQAGRRVRPPPPDTAFPFSPQRSPPHPHSVDNAPSEGRRGTRATCPRAVEEPPTERWGAGAAHLAPRAPTRTPGRPPHGGLLGLPAPLSPRGSGGPSRRGVRGPSTGTTTVAPGKVATPTSTATERGGGRRRVTGFGQCVTTRSRIWMGRAAAPSFVLLGDLALGGVVGVVGCLAGAGPQGEAGHRGPALGERRSHHSPPVVGDALGQATDAGQMSPPTEPALGAPGVVDVATHGTTHGDGHL